MLALLARGSHSEDHYPREHKSGKKTSGGNEHITNIFKAQADRMNGFCIGYHSMYIKNSQKVKFTHL